MGEELKKGQLILDMDDPYVYALIKEEFLHRSSDWDIEEPNPITRNRVIGDATYEYHSHEAEVQELNDDDEGYPAPKDGRACMQWAEYERVSWDAINSCRADPQTDNGQVSTIWYTYRKGLIRKAELACTVEQHLYKCPLNRPYKEGYMPEYPNPYYSILKLDQTDLEIQNSDDEEEHKETRHDTDSNTDNNEDSNKESIIDDEDENDENNDDSDENEDDDDEDDEDDDDDDDDSEEEEEEEEEVLPEVFYRSKGCPLHNHIPETYHFELRDPSELDELLICDLYEIGQLDNQTEEENFTSGNVWILKPSITNQGKEIHVIASTKKFREIMENPDVADIQNWVVQRYIHNPLLLGGGRKFHIRVHALANGSLSVYIADRMLALFSLDKYHTEDGSSDVNTIHITNVCYQKGHFKPPSEDVEFREEMAVLLLHDALEEWALEYTTAISTLDNNSGSIVSASQVRRVIPDQLPHHLQASLPLFKQYYLLSDILLQKLNGIDNLNQFDCEIDTSLINHLPLSSMSPTRLTGLLLFQSILQQIHRTTAEIFAAAAGLHHIESFIPNHNDEKPCSDSTNRLRSSMAMAKYSPIGNTSELYGIDFMVDARGRVVMLEVNAGPDFGQTGQKLKELVCMPMIRGVTSLLIQKHFPNHNQRDEDIPFVKSAQLEDGIIVEDYYYAPTSNVWDLPSVPHFTPVLHVPLD